MKVCIDEIEESLKTKKDERMEKIVAELKAIYEPVKTCKNIPVISSAKKIVDVVGETMDSDPEILKTIYSKCEGNVKRNEDTKKIADSREKAFGRLRY